MNLLTKLAFSMLVVVFLVQGVSGSFAGQCPPNCDPVAPPPPKELIEEVVIGNPISAQPARANGQLRIAV